MLRPLVAAPALIATAMTLSVSAILIAPQVLATQPEPKTETQTETQTETDDAGVADADALNSMAVAAYKAGRFGEAARIFDAAFAVHPHGLLMWNAARSYDRAGETQTAVARYQTLLERDDADPADAQRARSRLAELAAERSVPDHPEQARDVGSEPAAEPGQKQIPMLLEPSGNELPTPDTDQALSAWTIGGWTALGSGAAAAIAGSVLTAVAHGETAALMRYSRSQDGVVLDHSLISERAYIRREQAARGYELSGAVTLAAGLAVVVTGVVLLLLDAAADE